MMIEDRGTGLAPVLSNTERRILRDLAQEGGPLGKIIQSMVDYGSGLREALVMVDLTDEAQVRGAMKTQATVQACQWVLDTFAANLADDEEEMQDV